MIERVRPRDYQPQAERQAQEANYRASLAQGTNPIDDFAERINAAWRNHVGGIIEVGRLLIQAKEELPRGAWGQLFQDNRLPFSQNMANALMSIARNPVLSNSEYIQNLPPHWATLRAIDRLPQEAIEGLITNGEITCNSTGKDIAKIAKRLDEQGVYKWENLRRQMEGCIRFAKQWPNPTQQMVCEVFAMNGGSSYGTIHHDDFEVLISWLGLLQEGYEREFAADQERERAQRAERERAREEEQEARRPHNVGRRNYAAYDETPDTDAEPEENQDDELQDGEGEDFAGGEQAADDSDEENVAIIADDDDGDYYHNQP